LCGEAIDVQRELFVSCALGRCAHDHADVLWQYLFEDLLETRALSVGQLAADSVHRPVGNVHQVASRKADLAGETGALMADRILRHLHEHLVTGLEGEFDATGLALTVGGVLCCGLPVHFPRVEHRVAAASDVDERRLHARQHILHATEVDIADQAGVRCLGDIVLNKHPVFEHADLDTVEFGAHHHLAVDALAAGEKLGLGDHRAAAARVTTVAAPLLLRLKTGRAAHLRRLIAQLGRGAWSAHLDDRVGRVGVGGVRDARVAVFVTGASA
jgi:hypothetical protein